MTTLHCLIYDPIAFHGGSKIATRMALQQVGSNQVRLTILTRDPASWQHAELNSKHQVKIIRLPSSGYFEPATQGWRYWCKNSLYLFWLCWFALRSAHQHLLLACSGPGVDMALYLYARLTGTPLMQLIHGPVSRSRSIGYCLSKANKLFYLPSSKPSLLNALSAYYASSFGDDNAQAIAAFTLASRHSQTFVNGLPIEQWPTQCQQDSPRLFWAASLLKWKGLDVLLEALEQLFEHSPLTTDICYIQPQQTNLPITQAPRSIPNINWYENPPNLDEIRRQCNLFVSTSRQEPFGLSILEALAAGMCVIIPEDQAYWDSVLTHDLNCLKYPPNDAQRLAETLHRALSEPHLSQRLGTQALEMAQRYQAKECYWEIAQCIQHGAASGRVHLTSLHIL